MKQICEISLRSRLNKELKDNWDVFYKNWDYVDYKRFRARRSVKIYVAKVGLNPWCSMNETITQYDQ